MRKKCLQGQILLLLDGGHGFEIEEDSCIVEAKVGPYLDERTRLDCENAKPYNIPVSRPQITTEDVASVKECLEAGWYLVKVRLSKILKMNLQKNSQKVCNFMFQWDCGS